MTPLREQLARPGAFVVAAELVTSRGLITADSSRRVLELARELAADPRIDVLSITDNPGGHAMLAPDTLGTDLISRGQEVIIHLSCKDWNRNALESRGWKLGSEGFDNVLALSGDYPGHGAQGARRARVRPRLGRAAQPLLGDERRAAGRTRARDPARPDGLLPRLRRDEPQAARARGDAAVLQAAEEGRGGRALRHQPDRLEHAQGRRAAALDQARRPAGLGARERLSPLAAGGARVPPGKDPGSRRHRRAARARRAPRCEPGQGPRVLRRPGRQARRGRARSRLRRRLPRRPHAGVHLRRDPRPGRLVRERRLAGSSRGRSTIRSRTSSTSSSPTRRRSSRRTR